MRLDCSILSKQAHVIKYHNPYMWHDNTAVKAWGSLVKGTFIRDVLHSLFVILVRLSLLWILANRKLQIGLYTLYVYMWSICTLNLIGWKKWHNYNNYNTWGCGDFWWTVTTALFIHYCHNVPNVASQCVLRTRISSVFFQFVWSCSISHTSLTREQYSCTLGAGAPAWL